MLLQVAPPPQAGSTGESSVVADGGLSLRSTTTNAQRQSRNFDDGATASLGAQFEHERLRSSICEDKDLSTRIRAELVPPKGKNRFLPSDQLEILITRESIAKKLGPSSSSGDLSVTVREIWDIVDIPLRGKTSRQRIFAILCLFGKASEIHSFIKEGIFDHDLPFVFGEGTEGEVCRQLPTGELLEIQLFHEPIWESHHLESFDRYQGMLLAPCFEFCMDDNQKVVHYILKDASVLPFVQDVMVEGGAIASLIREGGYSLVRKVKIHPAHHNAHLQNVSKEFLGDDHMLTNIHSSHRMSYTSP